MTASADRPRWRGVDGILLYDKPLHVSSNQALQRVRRVFQAEKAGHTGSLDPLASGMLPLCFGSATKVCAYLLDSDKVYVARLALGARTSTGDREGAVVETAAVPATLDLKAACARLTGPIRQIPPMYSALKAGGERLYALARRGEEVPREPRTVTIHALEASRLDEVTLDLRVHCSKGTYVRTLGEDLALALGTVGHLASLRREWVAPFRDAPLVTDAMLAAAQPAADGVLLGLLQPVEAALPDWPRIDLEPDEAEAIRHGRAVAHPLPPAETERFVRLHAKAALLALGRIAPGATEVAPIRLLGTAAGVR